MLKVVAARLARAVGDNGLAIRWGGDEFVVVHVDLPDALPAVADALARPLVVKGLDLPVTLACAHTQTATREALETLIARAQASVGAAPSAPAGD